MASRLARLIESLAYLLGTTLRSPPEGGRLAKAIGASGMDAVFEHRSPLAYLRSELVAALGQFRVVLPPPGALAPGNQDLWGLVYLVSIARAIDARVIFEIGTYNGFTALTLATNVPDAIVHTLDLPPGRQARLELAGSDYGHIAYVRDRPQRLYMGTPEQERIVQHLDDSAQFDFGPFESACDVVYIDGAHSWSYVMNDSEAAFRMVRSRGVVVWDDYQRLLPDVPLYLDLLAERGVVRLPRSRLVVSFGDDASKNLEDLMTKNRPGSVGSGQRADTGDFSV